VVVFCSSLQVSNPLFSTNEIAALANRSLECCSTKIVLYKGSGPNEPAVGINRNLKSRLRHGKATCGL
jgi:hypothetical protein